MNQEKTDLQQARTHVEAYVSNHLELAKLEAAERTAKIAASVVVSLSTAILVLITIGFLSFAAAFYLSEILSGYHWGFLSIGGFYLLLLLIYALMGKPVFHKLYTNGIIKKIFKNHD